MKIKDVLTTQFVKFIEKLIKEEVKKFHTKERENKTISLEEYLISGELSVELAYEDILNSSEKLTIESIFQNEKLNRIIRNLDTKEKVILNKYYVDELSIEEISKILNTTPSDVYKTKSIILNKIRKEFNNG